MEIITKYLPFVNEQSEFHERMAAKFAESAPSRAERHRNTAAIFRGLAGELEKLPNLLAQAEKASTAAPKRPIQFSLTFDDIQGLPEELLQELSFSEGDKTDFSILKIIEECGGVASIDRILVGLYRKTGEIVKRNTLTSRLYRMGQKEMLFAVPGRKGVYSIRELSEQEAADLIG